MTTGLRRLARTNLPAAPFSILAIAAVAVLLPLPILLHSGWPQNHEEFSFLERIEGFRRAFLAHNWYPLWTPFCHRGYGSPYPLFYHRLHTSLTALLALKLGVLRAAKAVTVLLLFVGGTGMRRLLRVVGTNEPLALTGALLFLLAPYTLGDWLLRGAFAEFTAMVILPWLYADFALFLRGERHWIRLAIGVVLLFYAHTIITYFFLLSLLIFAALTLLDRNERTTAWWGVRREWPYILAAVLIGATVLPQVIVASRMMSYFQIGFLTGPANLIENHFQPISRYLTDTLSVDDGWKGHLSLEINRYVLGALVVLALLPGAIPRWRTAPRIPLYPFMLVWSGLCLLLQLPIAAPVFHWLPNATFIQFPWRLLAFITIGSIFLLIAHARAAMAGGTAQKFVAVIALGCAVLFSAAHFGTFPLYTMKYWGMKEINEHLTQLDGPGSQGEYMLRGFNGGLPPEEPHFVRNLDCDSKLKVTKTFNTGEFQFTADTNRVCHVAIRQFQTPLLDVEGENAHVVSPDASPRFVVELGSGHSTVTLRPRSFPEMLRWSLSSR